MYFKDGDRYFIFASKGGADRNPDWYHNLKAHPDIQVEIGDDTMDVHVEEIKGTEHDQIYARWVKLFPYFGDYQRKTKRIIPVLELKPRNGRAQTMWSGVGRSPSFLGDVLTRTTKSSNS